MIILLVDDEPSDALLVRHILAKQDPDIAVLEVRSCEEALQITATQTIDCVVMDQRLIGTSGSECIKKLRDSKYVGAFVLLTGFADKQTALEALQNGADEFLSKDRMHDALPITIAMAIERRAPAVRMQTVAQEQEKRSDRIVDRMDGLLDKLTPDEPE